MAKQAALRGMRYIPLPYLIGILILALDIASKYFIVNTLPLISGSRYWYPYGGVGVFDNFMGIEFSINHVTNKGAAWGLFADFHSLLFWLRIGLVGGLFTYLLFFNKRRDWLMPLILILAGAFGNILDVFLYGHVIDMFHFVFWGYDYPVFNIADASICIGIGWMMLNSWANESRQVQKKKS